MDFSDSKRNICKICIYSNKLKTIKVITDNLLFTVCHNVKWYAFLFWQSYTQCCVFSLLQDMEALKRSLALIESKMAQAKSWLKDPHGQPGNCVFYAFCWNTKSAFWILFHNVLCRRPQETPVRLRCVWYWMKLVRWESCVLGRRGKIYWQPLRLWGKWLTRLQIYEPGIVFAWQHVS